MSNCKRSCGCWTPYEGVCARQHHCRCHITQAMKDKALRALQDQQALLRAEAARVEKQPTFIRGNKWTH